MKKGNLMISNDGFSLEGKPLRILSGAIHYFRVPRDYWEERIQYGGNLYPLEPA